MAHGAFYDAAARLDEEMVDFYCPVRPASLSPDPVQAEAIRAEIERAALEVYRAYSVRDLGRIDLIWDGAEAKCFEVDVSPGMTSHSLFPTACEAAGLTMPAVMDQLVSVAAGRAAFER